MPTAANQLFGTIAFWLFACVAFAISGRKTDHKLASTILALGGIGLLSAAISGWSKDTTEVAVGIFNMPIYLAVAPLCIRVDALSSIFTALLALLTIAVSFYSPGYLQHLDKQANKGAYWVQLILFVIGMLGVLLSANAPSFLLFWELMAISSAFLIATDLSNHDSRKAAFIYLGATRIATAFLMGGFLWMYALSGSWSLCDWHLDSAATLTPAILMFIAFSIKGGVWPFHEWLPYAHPSAPSPVSALMSGVMIKVAIYAMIRIFVMGTLTNPYMIYSMLALGMITAFFGILSALMQKDLKCLLAYSSIENIGLILIALSLSMLANTINLPVVAAMSLAAAIFHAFNHGLFKAMLFMGAGTIDCRIHTRDLELMGGLGKMMPATMLYFILGSVAICSLPPLNGFSSKWLIYQSFFHLAFRSSSLWLGGMAIACIAILAMVSGMSLYCFTKAIGISFLGRPRSPSTAHATEGSGAMLFSQLFLTICCVALGLFAPLALAVIDPVTTRAWHDPALLSNYYHIPMLPFACFTAILAVPIYWLWLTGTKQRINSYITWDCGFGSMTQRTQGTATSFTQNIGHTFAPLLGYDAHTTITGRDRRHFPDNIQEEARMIPLLEANVYRPAVSAVSWLGERLMQWQAGSIHLYLGFILLTLVTLLIVGISL